MKKLEEYLRDDALMPCCIVSDVDDTITTKGELHPCALQAMYRLREEGIPLILLSGGSSGWCEVYLRQWPVSSVISESGAWLMEKDGKGNIVYRKNSTISAEDDGKREKLLEEIDPSVLSSDQYARLSDIAVDLSKTSGADVRRIEAIASASGASYALSSIHLNIWFGDYSKSSGLRHFFPQLDIGKCAYIGDSLNDEEMFSLFPLSFGVRSVEEKKECFRHLPSYFSPSCGGEGFSEIISAVVKRKNRFI